MLEELKTFIAVVKYRNFTKAGETVNLSQPAVSTHIGRLEKHYGTRLVVRNTKPLQITDNGWLLYRKAQEIVDLLEEAELEQREAGQELKGTLKIGATYTVGECVMPGILCCFKEKYPGIQLEMVIANTEDILDLARKEQIQIGFIEGLHQRDEFTGKYFMEDSMKLLVSKKNPLSIEESIKPFMLLHQNWISREEGSGTREYMDFFLTRFHIEPENITVMGSNYAIKEAIRHNMGITVASGLLVQQDEEICALDFDEPYVRPFSYVLHKEADISRAGRALLEIVEAQLYQSQSAAEKQPACKCESTEQS